jgi:hypothetical protein
MMDGTKLTLEQRDRLVLLLAKHRDALTPIIERMKQVGWETGDPVYNSILAAKHSLQAAISALPTRPLAPDVPRMPRWRSAREAR